MDDPNVIYKSAFRELTRELGRVPTANECLGLHDAYKRAWGPAEETVLPPARVSAAGPEDMGFSREPAPQARTEGEDARASEGQAGEEALSGPDKSAEAREPISEPEPPANKPEPPERPIVGTRGPGGGIVAVCETCGREWERPARRGRPARKCEECR